MSAPAFDPVQYKATTHAQWDTAAEAWDRWGPVIGRWLGPATESMLDMADVGPGGLILDVAAGAGEQTLSAARRVGPTGRVLATDISAEILGFADRAARKAGLANVETAAMDGEDLDLPDESFDVVISRVGLIYFPDRQRALEGMYRVLRPGGRIAAVTYSTPENNRFFSLPVSIIRQRANLGPPLPGQPGPFSLGTPEVLGGALRQAGFRDVRIEAVPSPLELGSADECVRFERESFGALHQMLSGLPEEERPAVWDEIGAALRQFERDGRFTGPCEMLVAVGTR
ncbi:MAG TPA: methyltransferase domain-containing protein [Burkholderiaceae bacterium]|nr:methyltransferase domain-containing protein [Burkholderiaceae bacterium]